MERAGPIVLYDGVCNLCDASVRFIIQRDRGEVFRFAALQSDVGRDLSRRCPQAAGGLQTIMLLEEGRCYDRSDAALRIARRLSGAWPMLYIFRWLPRGIRDGLYRLIARRRYRWFGRTETCHIPDANYRERFLDLDSAGIPIVSGEPSADE